MRLYIAEKPSVGRELAKCLRGPVGRHDGYLTTGEGCVTWLFGHILRQAEPQEYDARYKRWRAEDLPIIPEHWQLYVDKNCEKQFAIVKKLIGEADEIVHGGDPDREGQLLVDEVLDYLGNTKPVRRILLNALDEKSIKEANAHLRDNKDFFNLKQSALARARADWLIGMNLSRAYTLAARRAGHDKLVLPVGRVKTPTLALVVRREREIENFQPVDYYTIKGTFQHANGSFTAQWKPRDTEPGLDSENRLLDKALAEAKLTAFQQEPHAAQITAYQKTKKQEPQPLPFSLSTLQVLAGKMYGYAPQLVLDTAQQLYEKKLTTYPRSDCEYLPTNQFKDAGTIIRNIANAGDAALAGWAPQANTQIKSRAWNDKKISAHHAIIPTTVPADVTKMTETERNLYHLIARGYLAQFYPVHQYDQTKISVNYQDELFTASGRTERDPGWKVMYQARRKKADEDEQDKDEDDNASLPVMKKGDGVDWQKGELVSHVTKPPVRFTPSTLLAGMKEIHKYVKNPEAKKQLKDVYGIGTEATRATIIDDLIKRKFMKTQGKNGLFWGCSNYPKCRLTCDDKDGKPDLAQAQAKARGGTARSGSYGAAAAAPQANYVTYNSSAYTAPAATAPGAAPSAADWDELNDLFGAPQMPPAGGRRWQDKPRYSASPMEKLKKEEASGKRQSSDDKKWLCPHCREGHLRRIRGRNGYFWGCTNYPRCTVTYDDQHGAPVLQS